MARILDRLVWILFWIAVAVTVDIYLWRVLGMSDATRAIGNRLRDYVWIPFRNMLMAVWEYLPNLLTILLVVAVARLLLWTVRQVFKAVQAGTLSFPGFDRDWANPTYRVVRVLAVGLTLAIIFPLLPAYDSDAFKGLSIFGGFLLAFGSSGAVGNLVSGVFLTYTRACKPGDRVQIGDTLGDVQEQTFLALRIRTDRNQIVTIPSSVVLNSSVTNYTRRGLDAQTLLHTGVTIGYDAPWRTVHELLLKAALETPDVLSFPEPFVWQRALNDFYVSYELNVATTKPERMYWILDDLHRHIQDAFFAAGVEIVSPHFYALRDGNGLAMPEAQRPPGYESPAFQVSVATARVGASHAGQSTGDPRPPDDDPACCRSEAAGFHVIRVALRNVARAQILPGGSSTARQPTFIPGAFHVRPTRVVTAHARVDGVARGFGPSDGSSAHVATMSRQCPDGYILVDSVCTQPRQTRRDGPVPGRAGDEAPGIVRHDAAHATVPEPARQCRLIHCPDVHARPERMRIRHEPARRHRQHAPVPPGNAVGDASQLRQAAQGREPEAQDVLRRRAHEKGRPPEGIERLIVRGCRPPRGRPPPCGAARRQPPPAPQAPSPRAGSAARSPAAPPRAVARRSCCPPVLAPVRRRCVPRPVRSPPVVRSSVGS